MSRRKQSKPQQLVHTQDFSLNSEDASDSPPAAGRSAHVCRRCCAEFSSLSELEQHQTDCSPNPPVLILNDEPNEPVTNINTSEDRSYRRTGFMESFSLHRSTESPGSSCSDQSTVLCTSVFPQSSPDQDGFSWMKQNVVIESLESTKVAVAQLSDSRTSVSSLLQQLLALQIQQIHQLQLIDQIRHQLLLIASRQAETPETLLICTKDLLPSSRTTNQLKALGAHLSRQLAAAAGIAKCLSSQSANIGDFRCLNQSNKEFLQTVGQIKHQHFLSQTKMSSLMFNNSFITKTSENLLLPPSSSGSSDSISNLSEIVEDLDALAALARQRKCTKLSAPTPSLFKHTCRFCTKVFGSDSALQIHLRSHTRERPYRCNICGNRFSTRGNLKVHFQRHKDKNPHIRLDETQTAAGIPFGLSPERAAARWFDRSPSSTTNLSSLIKKEDNFTSVPIPLPQSYFNSSVWNADPLKTSNIVDTRQQRTMNLKSEDVKPSFNFVSKVTTWNGEESVNVTANPFSLPSSTSFSGFLSLKRSDKPKLQLPPVRAPDLNECIICHRVLSCQSALRMHYRTHTGERPHQCKLCGRAFTTKGNLKTHQAVHRATVPLRVQHSCPICHKKFMNAVVLQQHVHVHMEGHLPAADLINQKVDFNEGFRDKRKNFSGFCDDRFKSLSIHVSPSLNLTDANKKTSYPGWPELQLKWIKTERPEGSNEECSQTNNQQAAERGQRTSTFPTSDSSASDPSLFGQASVHLQTTRLDEALHSWLDSNTLTLCTSATAPADPKLFNHGEDPPGSLREKGLLKNTYCDICGKSFACQSALDIHYRSHTKERPFICTTCSRGFSTKGNLKQHMLTHQMRDFPPHLFEPSNPNQAPNQQDASELSVGSQAVKREMFLSSSFRNGLNLSGRPQNSSVCAAAPPRRTSKQHHCRTCGKSFSSSSALQIHERTHTGERPFACAVCGRAFTTKGNLKVHMGTHMWNSAPSRRGRRLSVDRSSLGFGTRPVKLPEPSQKSPETETETETAWNQQQQQV